ncbi:hypothetical protein ONZ43_g7380 [Nemania bipapillata]|uniref:Uncharacterized protein n=1 Tax=Nemania bipapillata TaxID=110536 RepID=A0ACC2HRH0_9PEZI|nr:hypothetical protein ONZ43_g7380 [Nemania bipapillata]
MDEAYVPPWRRRQALGDASADNSPANYASYDQSHQGAHNSTNNNNNNQRASNNRQGYRGSHRGGRGGHQRDFFQKKQPQVDQSDTYHQDEIHNYFWGGDSDARDSRNSTFHDSKDHPQELAYMLLFFGANPRWTNDRIVFAKSKLALLPEYAVKKAENGEWETEKTTHKNDREATQPVKTGIPEDHDTTTDLDKHETEVVTQDDEATSSKAASFPGLPSKTQDHKEDATISITTGNSTIEDGKSGAEQEVTQDSHRLPARDLIIGEQESNTPAIPVEDIGHEKRGDEGGIIKVESGAEQTAPVPSSTTTTSRLKYTDIRKEEMNAGEIRIIPANKYYRERDAFPSEPVFPAIAPIDYVPTKQLPIAIFEEQRIPGLRTGGLCARFAFKGWFTISRVNILAPHSAELVRMLQQKWERKDRFGKVVSRPRDASAWNASLAMEWAVIGFKLLEGEDAPPHPQIEKLPEPERPGGEAGRETKSVNEMLSEMRLNDGNINRNKENDPE